MNRFFAPVLALTLGFGCSSTPAEVPDDSATTETVVAAEPVVEAEAEPAPTLVGPTWLFNSLNGEVVQDSQATLIFNEEGEFNGHGGCNNIFGTYEVDGEKLKITPAGSTKMACEPLVMSQEDALLATLALIETHEIDAEGTLTLKTADGKTVAYRR